MLFEYKKQQQQQQQQRRIKKIKLLMRSCEK